MKIDEAARRALMTDLLNYAKSKIPEGFGATIFVFDYGDPRRPTGDGEIHYGSTAQREDMLTAIIEFLCLHNPEEVLTALARFDAQEVIRRDG